MAATATPAAPPIPREPAYEAARFPPASREPRLIQTARMSRDPLGYFGDLRKDHGSVFLARVLPNKAGLVCVTDPADLKWVLTDQEQFVGGEAAAMLEPLLGANSLILTPPPRHIRNRKLLLPPFHGESIARWGDRVRDLVVAQAPSLSTGEPVEVRPWAQRITLDVILRVVFGLDDPDRVERTRAAIDRMLTNPMQIVMFAPRRIRTDYGRLSPGHLFEERKAAVDDLIYEQIAERRADPNRGDRDDVLSILLDARDEDGEGFTDTELRDELMGLLMAGHETTATAIAWTMHLLAHNPGPRDELLAEIDEGESEELLKATIRESMRIRAPVFDAVRIATTDTEIGGQPVPAGAFISALFCVTHLDSAYWPEPEVFRPRRHLDDEAEPYSWTPFGGGVRRCIGASLAQLELEVALRELLSHAVPEPAGSFEASRLFAVTQVPAKGGRVRLRPR